MRFDIITLFPDMSQALQAGVIGHAIKDKRIHIKTWNPRDYAQDKHKSVDDHPYGGGPGMVMMAEPLISAIKAAKSASTGTSTVIYLSPQGKLFDQAAALRFAQQTSLILVAGRYEGIDERIIQQEIDEEWSIGDYILTGGELAALVMIDAIARVLPGVVGDNDSITQDSLANGLLKHPQYTRPDSFNGARVPEILLSGNHERIKRWRHQQALGQTWLKRPDLLKKKQLTNDELALLTAFIDDFLK